MGITRTNQKWGCEEEAQDTAPFLSITRLWFDVWTGWVVTDTWWEFYINSIFRKLVLCSVLTLTTVYITDTTVLYYNIDVWQKWRIKLWNELPLPFWWNCEPSPSTGGCSAPGCNGRRFLCHRSPGWTVWRAPTKTQTGTTFRDSSEVKSKCLSVCSSPYWKRQSLAQICKGTTQHDMSECSVYASSVSP